MAITPRMRYDALHRDGFACRYCGARPPGARLQVDHIVPRSRGGSDVPENLIVACFACNQGKKAKPVAGIEEEHVVDPLITLCDAAILLWASCEPIWHDRVPTWDEAEEIKWLMCPVYDAVMQLGEVSPENPWRPRWELYRSNTIKYAMEEAERHNKGRK